MADYSAIDRYVAEHLEQTLAELEQLCAQPSVSASGEGIAQCAVLVAEMLRHRGFNVELVPTAKHPVVYGEAAGASEKTLLLYNHYDVQPPEPLELWTTPAFKPSRRDSKMFARGVSDDKGHIVCRLAALDAIKAVTGSYPCRIKFIIEGEEEIGSPSLKAFIEQNRDRLKAEGCIWETGMVDEDDTPIQYLGMRGILSVELSVKTADLDSHSGMFGSVLPSAAWRLVWALSTLKDHDENILIPGFYDDVKPPTARDREIMAAMPDDSEAVKKRYGVKSFIKGITGGLAFHESVFSPTCNIEGITSGYQGPGGKTIVPAQASAKLDFRLVPDQQVEDILQKLRKHLDSQGFQDIQIEMEEGGGRAGRTDPDDPFVQLTVNTAHEVYGREMRLIPMAGGSGPNAIFIDNLNVPIVMAGFGYPGDRLHAPDENMRIDLFEKGVKHTARIVLEFAGQQ